MTPSPSDIEPRALAALQRGLPLAPAPFAALARETGCAEADLLAAAARARARGVVRRFGAVFDTRRLGYRSVLCAAAVPPAEIDAAAARLAPLDGVTHCYERTADAAPPGCPNLWFTLSYPADIFPAMADEAAARLKPHTVHLLPAVRRYKVDVVFGAATRAREERTDDDLPPLTPRGRAVVGALQGDTEIRPDYFAAIAARLGMKEWDLLSELELWRRNGRLKRVGLLLAHRAAGWTANGMCCWRVDGGTHAAGRALADCPEVTHCYERPQIPSFPYNLFAMVHGTSRAEADSHFAKLNSVLSSVCPSPPPSLMLLSTKEYKKTSMTFYKGCGDVV